MKTPHPRRQVAAPPYESRKETKAAVGRIHAQFEETKQSLAKEELFKASPAGVLEATLEKLLNARKSVTAAHRELSAAIIAIKRVTHPR